MSFPTYEHFKDSGFQWLGKVPDSWEVNVSRRYFYEIREAGKFDDVQLSATQKFGVVPQSMFMELEDQKVVLALKGLSNFKHVEPDDFVISLRSFQGGIERSKYRGCVSPAYTVLRPKKIIDPAFIAYVFKSAGYIVALQSVTDGIREGKNIKYDQFAELGLALPPVTEQKIIAKFLDHETAKIDSLVAEQEKLIELLKEKRHAVISDAVTKGLDPKVKMKDSGVEWLGKVPEHWVIKKIKFVVHVMTSNVDKKTYDGETPCLLCNYTDVYYNDQILRDMEFMSATATPEQINKFTLKKGDVIITKDSESPDDIAVAAYVPMDLIGVVCGYHLSIIRAFGINGMFVKRLFDSHYLKSKFATLANGLTRYGLGQHSINNVYIPIPPEEEQQRIVGFINKTCNGIDELIDKSKTTMNLLTERRSAIISAAVTGQIDVRNYQPKEVA